MTHNVTALVTPPRAERRRKRIRILREDLKM